MKLLLFGLLFLGVIGFAIPSFAEVEHGENYNREIFPGYIKWTSAPDRILVNDVWLDSRYTVTDDYLILETGHGSVKLNKNTCSFDFYKSGIISGSPLFTDSIVAKMANIGTENWSEITQITNAACEVYGSDYQLVAKKYVANVGYIEYKYINTGVTFKTQLEATNLSSNTNKKFGFTQTVDLYRDTITFGGSQRNLDNFNNQSFDRAWLETNKGKVINFLNSITIDFDKSWDRLHSVNVYDTGANKSKLAFNYIYNATVILPNQTLIIDPTYASTSPNDNGEVQENDGTNDTCSNPGISVSRDNTTSTMISRVSATGFMSDCFFLYLDYNIASIPTNAVVTDVDFDFDVQSVSSPRNCDYNSMGTTRASASDVNVFNAIFSGTTMLSNDATCATAGNNKSVDLGSAGDTAVQTRVTAGDGFFTFGIKPTTVNLDGSFHDVTFASSRDATATPKPTLTIVYVMPPDKVTDLTSTAITTSTVNLDWTAPSAGGGGQSIIGYQINITTPQTKTPLVFLNDTGTSTTDYLATGLTSGTNYSARVSAWTNNTAGHPFNNATGNVYNFTTYILPAGTLSITTGNIGDTLKVASTLNITTANPLPVTVTTLSLYQDNILVSSDSVSTSISSLNLLTTLDNMWYQITDSLSHSYSFIVTTSNGAGTKDFMATNFTLSREYNPDYLPAVDNPSTQGLVNATVERFDSDDGILLKVNRVDVSTGETWQIECIAQTNSEAARTKNQTADWEGDWSNDTDTGYFNTTYTGFQNSHAYITCFNEDELFTLTDFTDSSLALLGIQLFDESYGSMIGVPVGIFFLVMTAGMANKRTAPTFIIVITGMAGTMATIGFFSFEPLVWGLALVTAMLGIFVNQKIF